MISPKRSNAKRLTRQISRGLDGQKKNAVVLFYEQHCVPSFEAISRSS
jgi:hypothetical protein